MPKTDLTPQLELPSLPLMNAAFVLAGLATMLLGPILLLLVVPAVALLFLGGGKDGDDATTLTTMEDH